MVAVKVIEKSTGSNRTANVENRGKNSSIHFTSELCRVV